MFNNLKFFVVGLISLLVFQGCGTKIENEEVVEVLRPVKFGKIASASDAFAQVFSGTAQSSEEAKISFKVNGTLTYLGVKLGDIVRKGQLIARLDATDYAVQQEQAVANLRSAETQIKSAESQLVNARSTYQRIEKLYENNSVSLSEFEQAKSSFEAADAQYKAAQAQANATQKQVESAQNQVEYAQLLAPFSGVISAVNVVENESVGAGNPIATLNTISDPEVQVGVPETFINQIKQNQVVTITFSIIPGETFTGKVSEVSFSASGASTYPVIITIDKKTDVIRPGMAASVRFNFNKEEANTKQAMVAPVTSIGEGSDGHFVFKLIQDQEGYLVRKETVEIGNLTDAGFEIKAGATEGDLVATAGLSTLLDGMRVTLME